MSLPKILTRFSLRQLAPAGLLFLFLAAILLSKLGSLTHGISGSEVATITHARGWHAIFDNPLNAPLLVLERLVAYISLNHVSLFRLPSVLYGLVSLSLFTLILKRWYGTRAAWFGVILFSTSSFFLHLSRLAAPDVLQLVALPALIMIHILLSDVKKAGSQFWLWLVVSITLLYVPGLIWFVIINSIWQRQELLISVRTLKNLWQRILVGLLPILLLAPLLISFVRYPSLIRTWLGFPNNLPAPLDIVEHLIRNISGIFVWQSENPELHVGHLPLLTSFFSVLCIVGLVFYSRHWQAPRSRLLFLLFIGGLVLSALGGQVSVILVIPIVLLVVVAGVAYLLHEWLRVFPRNPLARSLGIGIIGAAISLSALFGLREYFIAWPHNNLTRQAFMHQLVLK